MPREKGFLPAVSIRLVESAQAYLEHNEVRKSRNALISHFRTIDHDRQASIKARARLAQRRHAIESLEARSPLEGHIVAVKDNIWTNDLPTTCASNILKGFQSPTDAHVVRLLKQNGVLVTAKTNMDEFGMGSHSTHSYAGPVINGMIRRNELSAGGSSGGSAIAVMTGHCHLALGTDTGGSVRLPAAYTGLVGFKPSYGMLSRFGVVPYANSLDTVGIIARNCLDVQFAFRLLNSPDDRDPTCLSATSRSRIQLIRTLRSRGQLLHNPVRVVRMTSPSRVALSEQAPRWRARDHPEIESTVGTSRRIGVPAEYNIEEMSDAVRAAWARLLSHLESRGHTIVPISLPATKHALSAYYVLAPAEASSNLAKYDGVRYGQRGSGEVDDADGRLYAQARGEGFGKEVKRRILLGAYTLSADAIDNYFIQAQRVRRLVQKDFDQIFRMRNPLRNNTEENLMGVDFIVCPTAPSPPPSLSSLKQSTSIDAYMNDVFTVPSSLAGLPAISIPAPPTGVTADKDDELIGMQIIGQYGDDHAVLQFARREAEMFSDWQSLRKSKQAQPGRIR